MDQMNLNPGYGLVSRRGQGSESAEHGDHDAQENHEGQLTLPNATIDPRIHRKEKKI